MAWFRVDDTFTFNSKTVECSNSAIGAWTLSGAWSCQQLTDGFIPKQMLRLLRVSASDASELVAAGLWKEVEAGYQFHDWDHYQPSAKQIKNDRAELREKRAEAGRKGGIASGHARREASASVASKQEVEATRSPIPSQPISSLIYMGDDEAKPEPKKRKSTSLPKNWEPNDAHKDKVQGTNLDINFLVEQFRNDALSKDKKFVEWDRAFHTWINNAIKWDKERASLRSTPGSTSQAERDPYAWMDRKSGERGA